MPFLYILRTYYFSSYNLFYARYTVFMPFLTLLYLYFLLYIRFIHTLLLVITCVHVQYAGVHVQIYFLIYILFYIVFLYYTRLHVQIEGIQFKVNG